MSRRSIKEVFRAGVGGAIGALLTAGVGLLLLLTPLGGKLERISYDFFFPLRPNIGSDEAVIIYMDAESHDRLGQPRTGIWDRDLHARLVERIAVDDPTSITFDIFFADPGPNDDALVRAVEESGVVIAGADSHTLHDDRTGVRGKQIVPPFDALSEVVANIGSVEVKADDDLVVREHLPWTNDDLVPTLAWSTAELWSLPIATNEVRRAERRWMNYYGPPGTIPSLSYHRVVSTNAADVPPPPGYFRDKAVFIGANLLTRTAGERKDEYSTPYSFWLAEIASERRRFIPGVEIQATLFLNLLRGDWLTRMTPGTEAGLTLLFGGLIGLVFARLRPVAVTLVAVALVPLVAFGAHLLFSIAGVWTPWVIWVFPMIPVAWASSVAFNSIRLYIEKQLLQQSLAAYLSPKLVRQFADRRDNGFLRPGAEKHSLTILFSDIADFTRISEGMDSDDLARVMNNYFESKVNEGVHRTDGTVVKYIGDAIFAFWNAPDPQADHAARACRAALLMRDQVVSFEKLGRSVELKTRIGLHSGEANVGNFGSTTRVDYTALGENINLASRMEGLNKYLGTEVLITGETAELAGDAIVTRPLGRFILKGFEKHVEVHELVGVSAGAAEGARLRSIFATALIRFQQRDWAKAEEEFQKVLELKPDDGPAKYYLKVIAGFRQSPPPAHWRGEIELLEK